MSDTWSLHGQDSLWQLLMNNILLGVVVDSFKANLNWQSELKIWNCKLWLMRNSNMKLENVFVLLDHMSETGGITMEANTCKLKLKNGYSILCSLFFVRKLKNICFMLLSFGIHEISYSHIKWNKVCKFWSDQSESFIGVLIPLFQSEAIVLDSCWWSTLYQLNSRWYPLMQFLR
jgi:hypothetical protein